MGYYHEFVVYMKDDDGGVSAAYDRLVNVEGVEEINYIDTHEE